MGKKSNKGKKDSSSKKKDKKGKNKSNKDKKKKLLQDPNLAQYKAINKNGGGSNPEKWMKEYSDTKAKAEAKGNKEIHSYIAKNKASHWVRKKGPGHRTLESVIKHDNKVREAERAKSIDSTIEGCKQLRSDAAARYKADGAPRPGIQQRVQSFLENIPRFFKNAIDGYLRSGVVRRKNNEYLTSLKDGDKVVLWVHGLQQKIGNGYELQKQAEKDGKKLICLDIDVDRMDPWDAVRVMGEEANKIYSQTGVKVDYIGHSTGANFVDLAARSNADFANYVDSVHCVEGTRNGGEMNNVMVALFSLLGSTNVKYDDSRRKEARELMIAMNQPSRVRTVHYMGTCSMLSPKDGLDISGDNRYMVGETHFSTSGQGKGFNNYLLGNISMGGREERAATGLYLSGKYGPGKLHDMMGSGCRTNEVFDKRKPYVIADTRAATPPLRRMTYNYAR